MAIWTASLIMHSVNRGKSNAGVHNPLHAETKPTHTVRHSGLI
jgi:hypothetical protein